MSVSHTDSSFLKTLIIIIGALVAFMVLIIIAANLLPNGKTSDKGQDPMIQSAIAERIKPVGEVTTGEAGAQVAAAPAASSVDGAAVYQQSCFACHGTGAAGAPKFGDKGAWKPRIAQGLDTLYDHAIHGFKGMPPRGGNAGLSDEAVKAAVKHMVDNSK
jgi:cytochrome c5